MKIGVVVRPDEGSLRIYRDNILRELHGLGVKTLFFPESGPIPAGCDLVWEPGLAMRRIPAVLADSYAPVVGTLHGLKAFSLPAEELAADVKTRAQWDLMKEALLYDWRWYSKKTAVTVAVSAYAAGEAVAALGLPENSVRAVHPGIDHKLFSPHAGWQRYGRPYFFHVSRSDPKNNLERILAAYSGLARRSRPDLVAVAPDRLERADIEGVHLISEMLPQSELAKWYCGAIANVAPSLHETFCMPMIEAMACGCPVITSTMTACPEVAGNAAFLVNPRSVAEIRRAMQRLLDDEALWKQLRQKGLARAQKFTWQKSAEKLLRIFQRVIFEKGNK